MSKNSQWLTVTDLIEILQDMPQDAMVTVYNNDMFENGSYYATRDSIVLYASDEKQVEIGTNYNTQTL